MMLVKMMMLMMTPHVYNSTLQTYWEIKDLQDGLYLRINCICTFSLTPSIKNVDTQETHYLRVTDGREHFTATGSRLI